MYNRFFGLREDPFTMAPDPRFLYMTPQHRDALAGLTYAILNGKGLVVVTGDVGTGKTSLLATAIRYLPDSRAQSSVISNPSLTPIEFLAGAILGFGSSAIPADRAERLARLEAIVREGEQRGKVSVLFVDEADRLGVDVLEEIRLLGNFASLQIVLAGGNELAAALNREELRSLKQRVGIRLTLAALSADQVDGYIRRRWTKAGGTAEPPFAPEAREAVAQWSHGIPRLINSICDNALMRAFIEQSQTVQAAHVLWAVESLELAPRVAANEVPEDDAGGKPRAVKLVNRVLSRKAHTEQASKTGT
jgi:general secretion pathway protein A